MDIHRWLDETVLPEQPPSPHLPVSVGPPVVSLQEQPGELPRERHPPRKRPLSDSSLLDTRPARRAAVDVDDSADDSACSDACHPAAESPESSNSSQRYAPRRRRKTRPERYELAVKDVKERGTHVYRHQKSESRKTKRKTRRKKGDKLGIGPPQSFKAKNVPKHRLTLKPRDKLGLFNKGRASSPVKGRGLPDLVFSEMKFLQKHKDQPEAPHQAGLPRKKRKKDHSQAKHEEISAYFTSVRQPLAEKDVNIQAKEGGCRQSLVLDSGHERERTSLIDNAIHTVELAGKAEYLGFGSRGPRHESRGCVSWSESIRATPIRAGARSTTSAGQLHSTHGRQVGLSSGDADVVHSLVPGPPSVPMRVTDDSGERFAVSSLSPANHRISSSHSVPQRTYPLQPLHRNKRMRHHSTIYRVLSPSSMPEAVPLRSVSSSTCYHPRPVGSAISSDSLSHSTNSDLGQHKSNTLHENPKERKGANVDPQTSSSLSKLLQACNSAFDEERRQAATSRRPDKISMAQTVMPNSRGAVTDPSSYKTVRRLPTVRFAGVETCRPLLPNYPALCIYEEQTRLQRLAQQQQVENESLMQERFPMLDDQISVGRGEKVDCDEQEWRLLEEPMACGLDDKMPEDFGPVREVDGNEERFELEGHVVASGFWRPHKLY